MPDSSFSLHGKRALVIGAATGIGRAISVEFLAAGARVVAADVNQAGLDGTAAAADDAGGRLETLIMDVTDRDDVDGGVSRSLTLLGGLDTLVYSVACMEPSTTLLELPPEEWDRVMAVNLTGAFNVVRRVLPPMIAGGGGSVILLGSQLARVAQPQRAAYCTSKGGILQLARALAVDHAGDGIRVNSLSPGAVATSRLEQRFGSVAAAQEALGARHVLGRLGTAEEIATAARFLASDAARFMTASDLLVDGGYVAT
jgi:NAD(P)-dependent dehydrogenase (short-subunit alcohol dehydrogenase family)